MSLIEGLASACTLALLGAFARLWYKDEATFQRISRASVCALGIAIATSMIFSTGYGMGMSSQWGADVDVVNQARAKVMEAYGDLADGKITEREKDKRVVAAGPVGLQSPEIFSTPVPGWFWVCSCLLLFALAALSSFPRHVVVAKHEPDDRPAKKGNGKRGV